MKAMATLKRSLTIALVFCLYASIFKTTTPFAQAQGNQTQTTAAQKSNQPKPQSEDEVVRISTSLVQVDAVVTDDKGQQVTNLTPEDFEIREDNRAQKITNFSYVSTDSTPRNLSEPRTASANSSRVPPVRLRPEDVRRTYALVVDDFGLSTSSIQLVRQSLKKFVDEEMQPGDMVAIVMTSGSLGALQQFTSDKRILRAAIDRIRWNPSSRGQGETTGPGMSDTMLTTLGSAQQFREELYTVGTLGSLNYIVRGMRSLPGRKSVVLFSDGFKIWVTNPPPLNMNNPYTGPDTIAVADRIADALRRLTDLANRSSVVFYTVNAAGVQTFTDDASADLSTLDLNQGGGQFADRVRNKKLDAFDSQTGLSYLAQQTGGFSVHNTNNLLGGIHRVLDDQKGYYLIAYHPEESTFSSGKEGYKHFHKITVRVKRPGLRVRSRTGFYGVADEIARPVPHTRNEQLISALDSPFSATGVDLRMTSLFANDAKAGSFMRTLLHINARNLTFKDEPDGWHTASFDVLAVTFGNSGQVVDEMGRTHTIRINDKVYRRTLENGFDYVITVPVKKPGAYQLRVSLRDADSERLGSASEFITVPDLTKNRLALSGIILSGADTTTERQKANAAADSQKAEVSQSSLARQSSEGEVSSDDKQAGPALRQLRRGMTLKYTYVIYNAQLDRTTQKPQLTTQMRLYRDGQQVFAGRVQPLDTNGQPDLKRIEVAGGFVIGQELAPGQYVLEVSVTDELVKDKNGAASQWIDFEIVR